jgi:hypothetical protein
VTLPLTAAGSQVTSQVTVLDESPYTVVVVSAHGSFSTVVVVSFGSPGRHSSSALFRWRVSEDESPDPPQLTKAATRARAVKALKSLRRDEPVVISSL